MRLRAAGWLLLWGLAACPAETFVNEGGGAVDDDECGLECVGVEPCGATYGSPWDDEQECFSERIFVGCGPIAYEPDVVPPLEDEDGNCWAGTKAHPAAWRVALDTSPCTSLRGHCE